MQTRWIIGLASGSSADGVDAALVEIEGIGLELRARAAQSLLVPYSPDLRELIRKVSGSTAVEMRQVGLLHRLLGETFAAAARQLTDLMGLSLKKVHCIGLSGHTVWHEIEGRFASTLPLGMAGVVAERLGLTTLSDFRTRDVAAGGHGIPLEALATFLLFRNAQQSRVILQLGGLARVAVLPANCRLQEMTAFEASPCNLLLDTLVWHLTSGREAYDAGGKHAVQGRCLEPLLLSWLEHPFLARRPPRSVPRHYINEEFVQRAVKQARQLQGTLHDLLCTATHFVARAIIGALQRFLPSPLPADHVLLGGGGVKNGFLWHLLEQQLAPVPLSKSDEIGLPAQACKAAAYAVLAALTMDGVAGNVPSATGAAGSRLLGSVTPGTPANWARCLSWMAAQTSSLANSNRE
jgi:anhydro-N-acetylmuramic acid kinase